MAEADAVAQADSQVQPVWARPNSLPSRTADAQNTAIKATFTEMQALESEKRKATETKNTETQKRALACSNASANPGGAGTVIFAMLIFTCARPQYNDMRKRDNDHKLGIAHGTRSHFEVLAKSRNSLFGVYVLVVIGIVIGLSRCRRRGL